MFIDFSNPLFLHGKNSFGSPVNVRKLFTTSGILSTSDKSLCELTLMGTSYSLFESDARFMKESKICLPSILKVSVTIRVMIGTRSPCFEDY